MKNNQFTQPLLRSKRRNPNLAAFLSCVGFSQSLVPKDGPPGHVAVYAGSNNKRFVIRISHLNHGFDTDRPLTLPSSSVSNHSSSQPERFVVPRFQLGPTIYYRSLITA
ncbi:uncharacterized protein LOC131860154 [Cryptomeria japonica]|uniref:uncharacterized protein LOC131860154 n=1 Tax=Cryptomeria japonica TaxID=3369 RepID=UPI0027DA8291|nr:uncharacterized protein LOC131860154 [Cryptomeria japonica]